MKKALSWFALVLGLGLSIVLLGVLDGNWEPDGTGHDWSIHIGAIAFICVPMSASLLGIRYRRLAAWTFLIPAAILVFFAAYSAAIKRAWDYHEGWLSSHPIVPIALLYFIAISLAAIAFYVRRHVFLILTACAVTALFPLAFSEVIQSSQEISSSLLVAAAPLFILGLFWFITHDLGWPPAIPPRPRSLARRVLNAVLATALLIILMIAATAAVEIPGPPPIENCSGEPRLVEHKNSKQAVFVAKVVRLGNTFDFQDAKASNWAVVSVQEHFWGLPWWFPNYLILSHGLFKNGESYLIEVEQSRGWIARFLPVYEFRYCPNITPVKWANMKLRILRDGAPKTGVRIIGKVRATVSGGIDSISDIDPRGINVVIHGPSGIFTTTVDQYGIYDASGLPPGQYEVHAEINKHLYQIYGCASKSPELKSGDVWGCDMLADHSLKPM